MPIGTARMAHLCLPNSELHVGVDWENSTELHRALSDPQRPAMLLYPSESAADVGEAPPTRPLTLVVVDGTWSQAKKMARDNPILANLPRLTFQPERPSDYRIRREPKPHCVSTIEALMYVLGILEGDPTRFRQLLAPFHRMINRQIELKEQNRTIPCRHVIKQRQSPNVPAALRERGADIVCVVGEANAWPYCIADSRRAYPDELVHWAARRIATDESFEFVVAPRYPLAPNTTKHIAMDPAQLNAGRRIDELRSAWQRFVRDTDILCSWGCYATGLLVKDGGFLPELRFDLRALAKELLKRKLGTMEQFLAGVDASECPSLAMGRAGLRLGQLVRIAECFNDGILPGHNKSHQPVGAS